MLMTRKASDSLPRRPERRGSRGLDDLEDLLNSLPEETDHSELFNGDCSKPPLMESCSVGRWSSSSSLEYLHAPHEHDENAAHLKRVRFDSVQIREYAVCEGDHPHCPCPVSLDWQHTDTEVTRLETYEGIRILQKKQQHQELSPRKLSRKQREERVFQSQHQSLEPFERGLMSHVKGLPFSDNSAEA